ncbi:Protein P [Varanus komodoensis]|nr:Protein P [Varanus komodoensis]
MQSDPLVAAPKPGSASVAPPSCPSDEGASATVVPPASPKKKHEKRKHAEPDNSAGHKKARKEKAPKPSKKSKAPERPRHQDSDSMAASVLAALTVPTPPDPVLQEAMRVTPQGSPRRVADLPAGPLPPLQRGSISDGEIQDSPPRARSPTPLEADVAMSPPRSRRSRSMEQRLEGWRRSYYHTWGDPLSVGYYPAPRGWSSPLFRDRLQSSGPRRASPIPPQDESSRSFSPAESSSSSPPYYGADANDSEVDSTSPDVAVTSQGPASPDKSHVSFAELMFRLVQSLDIDAVQRPGPTTYKFYDVVHGEQSTSVILPLITTLRQAMTQPWDLPSHPQPTSQRDESMYLVQEEDIPFLLRHPKLNSVVVESSQGREARGHTAARDKEGRKINSLTREGLLASIRTTCALLDDLGLRINTEKSSLLPMQTLTFIGALLDSTLGKAFLPRDRQQVLVRHIHRMRQDGMIPAKSIQRILGHMASSVAGVPHTRLQLRPLQFLFNKMFHPQRDPPSKLIRIPSSVLHSLLWWSVPAILTAGVPFRPRCPSITLDNFGQHSHRLLSEQTRWNKVPDFGQTFNENLELVHSERYYADGSPSDWYGHCASRLPQQAHVHLSRMGTRSSDTRPSLSSLGVPRCGLIHHPTEQGVQCLLFESGNRGRIHRGCYHDPLEQPDLLRLPSNPSYDESQSEDSIQSSLGDTNCPLVATPSLVCDIAQHLLQGMPPSTTASVPHNPAGRYASPSRFTVIEHNSVTNPMATIVPPVSMTTSSELNPAVESSGFDISSLFLPSIRLDSRIDPSNPTAFHPDIQHILDSALKPSTRKSYAAKWRRFSTFAESCSFSPFTSSIHQILQFLLELHHSGLKSSSVKVYMAAIAYHRGLVDRSTIFSQPTVKRFLKGLHNLNPSIRLVMPTWSLSVVLQALTRAPFEPLATVDLRLVSWKKVFLVVVTSARRASELCALRIDPPYLNFHREKVVLRLDPSFLPKVATSFHMGQDIILPAFFPSPSTPLERSLHSLDVRRCLAFYRLRTESIRHSNRLFIKYSTRDQGDPVTPQRLSKWIVHTITLSYQLAKIELPTAPRSHSTRAVAASSAFASGVPIDDVCRAATWANPCTFARHYRLDVWARQDCSFGRAILSFILQ